MKFKVGDKIFRQIKEENHFGTIIIVDNYGYDIKWVNEGLLSHTYEYIDKNFELSDHHINCNTIKKLLGVKTD